MSQTNISAPLFDIRQQRQLLAGFIATLAENNTDNRKYGLLLADIRDFRRLNAVYGYDTGDEVLLAVAERLQQLLQPRETPLFRIGNDEFAIVLPRVMHSELLSVIANKALGLFQAPVHTGEHSIKVSLCIGAAATRERNPDACQRLLARAERALDNARLNGNAFAVDTGGDSGNEASDLQYETALHEAISAHALELHYQPKIDLFSQSAEDFEALVRWPHPDLGMIPPDQFLPIVERIGRYDELTKFVLHTALRHRNEWPVENARVAINVPASMVHESTLTDMVASALNIWGARPSALTLEITEGAIIKDHLASQQQLEQLRAMGVRISIDDFGTGYSSLAYFKKLPASELKIDKSFVSNMYEDADDRHLVQLITDLAHHFGLKVVAEGVENIKTLRELIDIGCDSAQGFYFARPMSNEALQTWLAEYSPEYYFSAEK